MTRKQLLGFLVKLEPCLVGTEACGSAHYWAREIERLSHTVKLISPQLVLARGQPWPVWRLAPED